MDARYWDERYEGSELVWTAEANRFVVAELEGVPEGRALDVAAGEGRNAVWLAERGWDVVAADFSAVGLAKADQLAAARDVGARVRTVVVDAVRDPLPDGPFDLVLVAYLHLPAADREVVERKAAAAVSPGGRLLVVSHDLTNLEHGTGGPQDPGVLTTPDLVAAVLRDAGLAVERAEQVERPVGDRVAIDHVVLATRPA